MNNESFPPSGQEPEQDYQIEHDPNAPKMLLDIENQRIASLKEYQETYRERHGRYPLENQEVDDEILDEIERYALYTRDDITQHKTRTTFRQRQFLKHYIGMSGWHSDVTIMRAFDQYMASIDTLRYAYSFGRTIAESMQDIDARRAVPPYLFASPRLLTYIRRLIESGHDPEFTIEEDSNS